MPPNMRILVRGTALVLGMTSAVAGLVGVATDNSLMALNSVGFIGLCALSMAVIFYSVALERIGLTAARTAATTLVAVLAGATSFMTLVFFALLSQVRFRDEASQFGYHSVAGILVLSVLGAVVTIAWHDR